MRLSFLSVTRRVRSGWSRLLLLLFLLCLLVKHLFLPLPWRWQLWLWGDIESFEGFNNVTGSGGPELVPKVIHFIRFKSATISFLEAVCLLSCLTRNPWALLKIHSDRPLQGDMWKRLKRIFPSDQRLQWSPMGVPTHVFGQRLTSVHHASDVARIFLLKTQGGIYLDGDVFVLKSLREFLQFEMVLGWPENHGHPQDSYMGNQVMVAHPNARFLKMYWESYRQYRSSLWYYNAGELPTHNILEVFPEVVHRQKVKLGVHFLLNELYLMPDWSEWREFFTIHLLDRHRYLISETRRQESWTPSSLATFTAGSFGTIVRELMKEVGTNVTDILTPGVSWG